MPTRPKTFESARYANKAIQDNRERNRRRHPLYNSAAWHHARDVVLDEQPICAECKIRPSHQVDHIIPLDKGGAALDRSNLQGLCMACHTRKTRKGD